MRIFKSFMVLFFFISCSSEKTDKKDFFLLPANTVIKRSVDSLNLETFPLEFVESSYLGYLEMHNDTIYYIDSRFCWIFRYNKDGQLIDRKLGKGKGPTELPAGAIDGYARLSDGGWLFMGSANNCSVFDNHFYRKKEFYLKKGSSTKLSYDNPQNYTMMYPNLIMKNYQDKIYCNVYSEKKHLSFTDNTSYFFQEARLFFQIDLKNGLVSDIIGRYSPYYDHNDEKKLVLFYFSNFDIDKNGNFYLSLEADSLIYCYDQHYIPKYTTGMKGRSMNTDYPTVSSEEFGKKYASERQKYAFYNGLKYIDETGLLFRTYTRGKKSKSDGVQIYKGNVLLGDIDVPKHFKMLGYSAPYYYASLGIDEENEKIVICKFIL